MTNTVEHNDDVNTLGTFYQGEIDISYAALKTVFGAPGEGDGYKVDAEWRLMFPCGTIATIYNYKTGKRYLGKEGLSKTKIRDWHIGGNSEKAVILVKAYLFDAGVHHA